MDLGNRQQRAILHGWLGFIGGPRIAPDSTWLKFPVYALHLYDLRMAVVTIAFPGSLSAPAVLHFTG